MVRDNRKILFIVVSFIVGVCLFACERDLDNDGEDPGSTTEKSIGSINFNFEIPDRRVPVDKIHRIDLSIAKDAKSLYSGYFLECANVSDLLSSYSFSLEEGEYYFQAGITCSCEGDTCLWDGFPGGQWGTKWEAGMIEIKKGETTFKNLTFSN